MIYCHCQRPMRVAHTRSDSTKVLRRYHCVCGNRITTAEYLVEFKGKEITLHPISMVQPQVIKAVDTLP